eukprot:Lithocolla_globosa_v1_NODE_67_length_7144_cov_10.886601.p2 type:complete len:168 gc:universal NODE_67_length_7144_cov_10.886601:5648-6151(+)
MIVKKITKYIGIFSKLRHFCTRKILINLYFTPLSTRTIYYIETWGNSITTIGYLQPLLIIQKKLVRMITFPDFNSHALPLFKKLRIMHIYNIFKFRISLMAHKYTISKTNIQFKNISFAHDIHHQNTRFSTQNKIFVHRYRSCFGQQTLSHKITMAWNSLPLTLSSA